MFIIATHVYDQVCTIVSASRLPPRPTTGQRLEDQDEKAGDEEKENEDDEHDRTKPSKLD